MRKPIVVAHRAIHDGPLGGVRPRHPSGDNSIAAIEAAAVSGADAVELDVRCTRDGHLVLGHDAVQWQRRRWLPLPYLARRTTRRSLASLDEVEDALGVALPAGLDIKLDVKDAAALAMVAQWCRNREVDLARIALWTRSERRIASLPDRDSFAEIALLSNSQNTNAYVAAAARCGATAVSFHPPALTARAVSAAHARELRAYAWIRDPHRHQDAVDLGVDGLVTDWVGQALAAIGWVRVAGALYPAGAHPNRPGGDEIVGSEADRAHEEPFLGDDRVGGTQHLCAGPPSPTREIPQRQQRRAQTH